MPCPRSHLQRQLRQACHQCSRCHLDCKSALQLHRHQRNGVTRCQHACRHCLSTLANVPERKAHEHECASKPAPVPPPAWCARDHVRSSPCRTCASTCGTTLVCLLRYLIDQLTLTHFSFLPLQTAPVQPAAKRLLARYISIGIGRKPQPAGSSAALFLSNKARSPPPPP